MAGLMPGAVGGWLGVRPGPGSGTPANTCKTGKVQLAGSVDPGFVHEYQISFPGAPFAAPPRMDGIFDQAVSVFCGLSWYVRTVTTTTFIFGVANTGPIPADLSSMFFHYEACEAPEVTLPDQDFVSPCNPT